ncbi:MAG TPA: nucleoside diphosphate kinase regulator [Steroidobacteraceae bacterium]|nr:nucleoside diphosphate kinase regulator [Steroidobacteraceae bacterium]
MSHAALPPITVSSLDFDRLEALLQQPRWQGQPMARALEAELSRAEVRAPQQISPDVVTMNSTVTCVEELGGQHHKLTLCYPDDADSAQGRVSVLAPVGAGLLGLSVGQSIDWSIPGARPLRLRVAAIHWQPEAAGQYHL